MTKLTSHLTFCLNSCRPVNDCSVPCATKVTSNLLDRENQLVLVKAFPRKDRAMDYYKVLTANRESMIDLNTSGFRMFVIHTENYVELFKGKDIEGYGQFFDALYLRD